MAVKIVIVVGLTLVIGITAWSILGSIVETATAPRVELVEPQFTAGPCQEDYFLWWVVGHHQMVTSTFGLKNDGLTDGRVHVIFTAEGAKVAEGDFFVGAGKTETQTFQFRVNDCGEHSFWAQLGDVRRS